MSVAISRFFFQSCDWAIMRLAGLWSAAQHQETGKGGLKHDSLMGTVTFSDGLELDKGDGCTTMQTYFIPWNRTLLGG